MKDRRCPAQDLVQPKSKGRFHGLLDGRRRLKSICSLFRAQPPLLTFYNVQAGIEQQQPVHIVNRTNQAARVTVLPFEHAVFKYSIQQNAGAVAAGLAQTVLVTICPLETREYQSTLSVRAGVRHDLCGSSSHLPSDIAMH